MDAYDRHHKELEEKLDEKTALLIRFQRISMEVPKPICRSVVEFIRHILYFFFFFFFFVFLFVFVFVFVFCCMVSGQVNASSPFKNEELSKALDAWSQHTEGVRQSGLATELEAGYVDEDGNPGSNSAMEERIRELNAMVSSFSFLLSPSPSVSPSLPLSSIYLFYLLSRSFSSLF